MMTAHPFIQAAAMASLSVLLAACCDEPQTTDGDTTGPDTTLISTQVEDTMAFPFCENTQTRLHPGQYPAVISPFFPKRTLEVALMPGETPDPLWVFVQEVAKRWEVIGIDLRFDTGERPDIVVSLKQGGLSSAVGFAAFGKSPSMFLGSLRKKRMARLVREWAVLHEFGHALGFQHEFGNPSAGAIPWNKPAVYAYFLKKGLTRDEVDEQIFWTYNDGSSNYSAFDPSSVMLYRLPDSLFLQKMNWTPGFGLSPCDEKFGKCMYSEPIGVLFKPCPC